MLTKPNLDNSMDMLLRRIQDPDARETRLVDCQPIPGSPRGELAARFDIHRGRTVEKLEDGSLHGPRKPLEGAKLVGGSSR